MEKKLRFNNEEYDKDSCPETWEMYKDKYKNDFGELLNFNLLEDKGTGNPPRCYIRASGNFALLYPEFKMSGDTIFNFGSNASDNNRKNRYYEKYKKLLESEYKDDKDVLQLHLNNLEECRKKYHDLDNFAFMPMTGGFQGIKGISCQENFAMFILEIKKYYEKKKNKKEDEHFFMTYRRGNGRGKISSANKEALKKFLNRFETIDENNEDTNNKALKAYFEKMYLVKYEDFEKKIIDNSEKIDSGEKVVKYMDFAKAYWDARK